MEFQHGKYESLAKFVPSQYECLYLIYLDKLLPHLFQRLSPTVGKKNSDYRMRRAELNYVLFHMLRCDNGLPYVDFQEIQLLPVDMRISRLYEVIRDSDNPQMFQCLLKALALHQPHHITDLMKKDITQVCETFYNDLIDSVSELGHTICLGGNIKLNIFETEGGDNRFVDFRKWRGENHRFPTTEGVPMTNEEFIQFVSNIWIINKARKAHSFQAYQMLNLRPDVSPQKTLSPRLWRLGNRLYVFLTGCQNLPTGCLPGVALIYGSKSQSSRRTVKLCSAGPEEKCSPWYQFSVVNIDQVESLANGLVEPIHTGQKRSAEALTDVPTIGAATIMRQDALFRSPFKNFDGGPVPKKVRFSGHSVEVCESHISDRNQINMPASLDKSSARRRSVPKKQLCFSGQSVEVSESHISDRNQINMPASLDKSSARSDSYMAASNGEPSVQINMTTNLNIKAEHHNNHTDNSNSKPHEITIGSSATQAPSSIDVETQMHRQTRNACTQTGFVEQNLLGGFVKSKYCPLPRYVDLESLMDSDTE